MLCLLVSGRVQFLASKRVTNLTIQSIFKKNHQQISPPSFLDPRAQAHPIQDGFHILWALRPWGVGCLGCWGDQLPAGMLYFLVGRSWEGTGHIPLILGKYPKYFQTTIWQVVKWLVLLKFPNFSSFSWISLSIGDSGPSSVIPSPQVGPEALHGGDQEGKRMWALKTLRFP